MAFELQYTSAPRGLTLGQAGFTTVKMTKGMPLALREALESLSSLHHARSHNGSLASDVCTSLLHLTAGGQRWFVLSRSADAGLDYTQRQNFFAHHIAFSPEEANSIDPLVVLKGHDVLLSKWDGKVEELNRKVRFSPATDAVSPSLAVSELVPSDWKAAIVAESLAGRVVYVIGEARLAYALMESLLSAVPESDRWDFTFITHFRSLSPTMKCIVRRISNADFAMHNVDRTQALVLNTASPGTAPVVTRKSIPPREKIAVSTEREFSFAPPKAIPAQSTAASSTTEIPQKSSKVAQPRSFGLGVALGAAAALLIALAAIVPIVLMLQSKNAQQSDMTEELTRKLATSKSENQKLNDEVQNTNKKLQEKNKELETAQNAISSMNRASENQQTQDLSTIDELRLQLKSKGDEIKVLQTTNESSAKELERLTGKIAKLNSQGKPGTQENPKEREKPPIAETAPKPDPRNLLPGLDEKERRTVISELPDRPVKSIELARANTEITSNSGKTVICKFEKKDIASIKYEPQRHEIVFEWEMPFFSKLSKDERVKIRKLLESATLKVTPDMGGEPREIRILELD